MTENAEREGIIMFYDELDALERKEAKRVMRELSKAARSYQYHADLAIDFMVWEARHSQLIGY